MHEVDVAREELLAAALSLVASRISNEAKALPGMYDDAEQEYHHDEFVEKAKAYVAALASMTE